jgi:hypothetical protein
MAVMIALMANSQIIVLIFVYVLFRFHADA